MPYGLETVHAELYEVLADAVRVLETSHPPVYYLPIADFIPGALVEAPGASFCEFKGGARYFDVVGGGVTASRAACAKRSMMAGSSSRCRARGADVAAN